METKEFKDRVKKTVRLGKDEAKALAGLVKSYSIVTDALEAIHSTQVDGENKLGRPTLDRIMDLGRGNETSIKIIRRFISAYQNQQLCQK